MRRHALISDFLFGARLLSSAPPNRPRLHRLLVRGATPEKTGPAPALSGAGANPFEGPIFSASIGEGHDLPARVLADGILGGGARGGGRDRRLAGVGQPVRPPAGPGQLALPLQMGEPAVRLSYKLITDVRPTRWFAARLTYGSAARPIRRAVLERAPDVVVSTYPGSTEVLGDLRAKGKIDVPVVSAITDLAALRFWAHPRRRPPPDHPPRVGRGGPPDRSRHRTWLRSRAHRRALLRLARPGEARRDLGLPARGRW